jgi:uncharacterized protein YggE
MYKQTLALSIFFILSVSSYSCCDSNTLYVTGAATIQVAPDLATFTVSAIGFGRTSILALSNVNSILSQATRVLQTAGLPLANYTTSSINLYPQYDYSNSTTVLVGQQATQSLKVTLGNLNTNRNTLSQLATSLGSINNITITDFSFENSDTALAYRQARLAAVNDARSKASQYISLSGRRLGSVRKVVDRNTESYFPFVVSSGEYSLRSQTLPLPYGQVQVSAAVEITWNIAS